MSVANTHTSSITISVLLNTSHIVKNLEVPVGSSAVVIGGDQKVVVEPTDTIKVSASNIADVIISTLEIS
jgi:hypothetical protein